MLRLSYSPKEFIKNYLSVVANLYIPLSFTHCLNFLYYPFQKLILSLKCMKNFLCMIYLLEKTPAFPVLRIHFLSARCRDISGAFFEDNFNY